MTNDDKLVYILIELDNEYRRLEERRQSELITEEEWLLRTTTNRATRKTLYNTRERMNKAVNSLYAASRQQTNTREEVNQFYTLLVKMVNDISSNQEQIVFAFKQFEELKETTEWYQTEKQ